MNKKKCKLHAKSGASPASRDRGGKIKIRGAKVFAEMRRLYLAEIANKETGLRRNPKALAFSGQNRKFQRFFRPKNTNLKKYRGGGEDKNRGGIAPQLATRLRKMLTN